MDQQRRESSGVHLLYQCGVVAYLVPLLPNVHYSSRALSALILIGVLLFILGAILDRRLDHSELWLIRLLHAQGHVDRFARQVGITKLD